MWQRLIEQIANIIKFIEQNPNTPILDSNWRSYFTELSKFCDAHKKEKDCQVCVKELEELEQFIEKHNRAIIDKYTEKITLKFVNFPHIQEEIRQQLGQGYMFVGYKGVDLERARRIHEDDLDPGKPSVGPTGAAGGAGFYTSPHFDTALDFAKVAATIALIGEPPDKEISLVNLYKLVTTPTPEISHLIELALEDIGISLNKLRKTIEFLMSKENQHEEFVSTDVFEDKKWELLSTFYQKMQCPIESYEWKKHATVIRIYVKNFFAMHGLVLDGQREPLPSDWEKFDYIEGHMQGGDEQDWEIKFNRHKETYENIQVPQELRQELRIDILPDLPLGCYKMLQEASEHFILEAKTSYAQKEIFAQLISILQTYTAAIATQQSEAPQVDKTGKSIQKDDKIKEDYFGAASDPPQPSHNAW